MRPRFLTHSADWRGSDWINIWPICHSFVCVGTAQDRTSDIIGKISRHDDKSWDSARGHLRVCHPRQWPSGKRSYQTSSPEEEQICLQEGSISTIIFFFFCSQQTLRGLPKKKVMERIHQAWAFPIKANSADRTNQSLEWASTWWGLDRLLVLQCDTFFSPIYLSIVSFILISSFTSKISIFSIGAWDETAKLIPEIKGHVSSHSPREWYVC